MFVATNEEPPPPKPDIPLDAWVPYWGLDASLPDARQRVPSMREVSPFWFNAVGVDQIVVDPNASAELTAEFMDTVRGLDVDVLPSIIDALPAGEMAAILADPATRARSTSRRSGRLPPMAATTASTSTTSSSRSPTVATRGRPTRPNWVAFIEELAAALRADGRSLTVSIPPVYDAGQTDDSGYWVYDYGAIVEHVDRIRIMTYDFSVGEPGRSPRSSGSSRRSPGRSRPPARRTSSCSACRRTDATGRCAPPASARPRTFRGAPACRPVRSTN